MLFRSLYSKYQGYIEEDVARELARVNLPLSLYTEFYWQIDLHNLFHFLKLRLDSHAQKEIRDYGTALAECAKAVAPIAYAAFENHLLNGVSLSQSEVTELTEHLYRSNGSESFGKSLKDKLGLKDES